MKVYIGIDWSKEKHDAIFMNEAGQAILYIRFAHMQEGFLELDAARQKLGVKPSECIVGIETSHNLIVESAPADARNLPSGCQDTLVTPPYGPPGPG